MLPASLSRLIATLRQRLVSGLSDIRAVAAAIIVVAYLLRLRNKSQKALGWDRRDSRGSSSQKPWSRETGGQRRSGWSGNAANGAVEDRKGGWSGNAANGAVEDRKGGWWNAKSATDDPPIPLGSCPICNKDFRADRNGKQWPIIRAIFRDSSKPQRAHLYCANDLLQGKIVAAQVSLEQSFAAELQELVKSSADVLKGTPCVRFCHEDWHLIRAAEQPRLRWPMEPPAEPPVRAIFALENVGEMRISSCPLFRALPADIGQCRGLRTLVLISTGISSLPDEMGALKDLQIVYLNGNFITHYPASMAALPELEELCLDSNQLQEIPPISSPKLKLFTAPANRLTAAPMVACNCDRIELHGNLLSTISFSAPSRGFSQRPWERLSRLKLMGNKLCELPAEIGLMKELQALAASDNQLIALPDSIATLPKLKWLSVYNNSIKELPVGLLTGSRWLEQVLLEGNPLSSISLATMMEDLQRTRIKLIGLDADQVRTCVSVFHSWQTLPPNVSVGTVFNTSCLHQYYMKICRASEIKRVRGMPAEGEPRAAPGPSQAPAKLLVVAFSASQGEPEWLSLMSRLAGVGYVCKHAPVEGPLADVLGGAVGNSANAKMWSGCKVRPDGGAGTSEWQCPAEGRVHLEDFDVLCLVDHRMRWYAGDEEALSQALASITSRYKHKLFVGASMGGFGAMLHAGRLAKEGLFGENDAVVAFGPQAVLTTATLRPPAFPGADINALDALANRMTEAARTAAEKGVTVEIHCAADEHFGHALAVPLRDLALHVHPLVPRKPFAKLLDKANVLMPILADVLARILTREAEGEQLETLPSKFCEQLHPHGARAIVARWECPEGRLTRNWVSRHDLVQLCFGPNSTPMPRPGDWFCKKCSVRNMSARFFCLECGAKGGSVVDVGTARIPGGNNAPRRGDWGCGKCCTANCGYDQVCTRCKGRKDEHPDTYVVE